MNELEIKIKHLQKHFDFDEDELGDIAKLYQGLPYPKESKGIAKLRDISSKLCEEWNHLLVEPKKKKADKKRKKELLRLLFPTLPNMPGDIRRGMKLVIGMVDISNFTFINAGADFGVNTLVKLGKWTQLGPNFKVLEEEGPAKHIYIDDQAWLGGKVEVAPNVRIGVESVVASGARVIEDLPAKVLAIGRPARVIKDIPVKEVLKSSKFDVYNEDELSTIWNHYVTIGHKISRKAFQRIFSGSYFSTLSISLGMLYLYTHALCRRLDDPSLNAEEREEILDQLFPIRGKNIQIGKNFFMDLAGTMSLGDNVRIGDNVALGGLVRIEDDVEIGDGCLLFGSNHPISAKRRKAGFNEGLGFSIPVAYVPIHVRKGVKLGKDVTIAPKADIKEDVPDGALVDPKGRITL